MIGTSLNQFRITAKLGQGGMGEVYRATDTKLGREVAMKVLPASFTQLEQSVARFEREAKALATLSHPNIAAIHGFDCAAGTHFLVMELVDGETLDEKLRSGPLPIEEALQVAQEIAEALESAHARGIVHRDLKPANIKITPDGRVKVLDFGLAKAMTDLPSSAGVRPEDSPTLLGSVHSTMPGVILGTAAYMSPEQARGKPVDHRSDIWSFGAVLFECLSGRKLFTGESVSDILAGVLKSEIDWTLLPAGTPLPVQWLLRKCLTREKRLRLQEIADARVDLDRASEGAFFSPDASNRPTGASPVRSNVFYTLLALSWLLVLFLALFSVRGRYHRAPDVRDSTPQTYTLNLHPDARLETIVPFGSSVILAPDCSKVVYHGIKDGLLSLYWKMINDAEFKVIPQSVRASSVAAFSPTGDQLVFSTLPGELKIFSFQGGLPRSIRPIGEPVYGIDWPGENEIFYTMSKGLYRLNLNNPTSPELLLPTQSTPAELFHKPHLMPDGNTLLFSVTDSNRVTTTVESFDVSQKIRRPVHLNGVYNFEFFRPTGHLLYGRDDVLWARSFDPVKLEFRGPEFPLLKDLGRDWGAISHQFTIAQNGTLIYARGHQTEPRFNFLWVRSQGEPEILPVPPGDYRVPKLSPSGDSVVVLGPQSTPLLVDLSSGARTELPKPASLFPYTPISLAAAAFAFDGTNAWFNRLDDSKIAVVQTRIDGKSAERKIYEFDQKTRFFAKAISPNRRYLALQKTLSSGNDIYLKDLSSDAEPQAFAATERNEAAPAFSPDSQWIAFTADLTDRSEVYVRNVADGGLPIQVSKNSAVGGAAWSPDGDRLYFVQSAKVMVAKIKTKTPLSFEAPTLFANGRFARVGINGGANFAAASGPDGDRLLMLKSVYDEPEPHGAAQVTAIVHFDEYLRRKTSQ